MSDRKNSRMEIRELLRRWGSAMDRIRRLEEERAFYRAMAGADGLDGSIGLTGMSGGGGGSPLPCDAGTDAFPGCPGADGGRALYFQQVRRIEAEAEAALRLRNRVQRYVARLTPLQERVIACRYRDGLSWRQLAVRLFYDEASLRRIEAQAVDAIRKMIEAEKTEVG